MAGADSGKKLVVFFWHVKLSVSCCLYTDVARLLPCCVPPTPGALRPLSAETVRELLQTRHFFILQICIKPETRPKMVISERCCLVVGSENRLTGFDFFTQLGL